MADNSAQSRPPARRLPGLETLRFVGAFCVLLLHVRANFGGTPVFGRGYLGVDFFLMLSGFLMARTQEPKLAAGASPWLFMVARYKRLWPMMAAGGVIGLPMELMRAQGLGDFLGTSLLNLALLPAPWGWFIFPLNIPAWTIFFELAMNALHVTCLWRLRGRLIWLVVAVMLPVTAWAGHHYGSLDLGARSDTALAGAARILLAYSLGIGLSRWWGDKPPVPIPPWFALVAMPVALVSGWWFGVRGWWFDLAFVLMICPAMIAGALRLRRFDRAAGLIGQVGFPLFALQMPILQAMRQLHSNGWVAGALCVVAGVAGAWIAAKLGHWRKARTAAATSLAILM